jgi:hypothetical protein
MPKLTITVSVDRADPINPKLRYTPSGLGGYENNPLSHGIYRNTELVFETTEPKLLIQFKGPELPFQNKGRAVLVVVTGNPGGGTQVPQLRTRQSPWGPSTHYAAVMLTNRGEMIWDDPELEDGGEPGGPDHS